MLIIFKIKGLFIIVNDQSLYYQKIFNKIIVNIILKFI